MRHLGLILGLLAVNGLFLAYLVLSRSTSLELPRLEPPPPPPPAPQVQLNLRLWFATPDYTRLVPQTRTVIANISEDPQQALVQMASVALAELALGPAEGASATVPPQFQAQELFIANGTAYVDIDPAALQSLALGTSGEVALAWSIAYTLTELPGIRAVKLLVGGGEQTTLLDNIELANVFIPPPARDGRF